MTVTSLSLNDMLETKMVYDGERQKVLAQNMANKDIPGYKAQDLVPLDFSNVLAAQNSKINLAVTSPMHFTTPQQFTQRFTATAQKNSFEESSTGNTVVTEEQMMKVAQNAIDYQMSTSLYKKVGNLFKEALGLQPS